MKCTMKNETVMDNFLTLKILLSSQIDETVENQLLCTLSTVLSPVECGDKFSIEEELLLEKSLRAISQSQQRLKLELEGLVSKGKLDPTSKVLIKSRLSDLVLRCVKLQELIPLYKEVRRLRKSALSAAKEKNVSYMNNSVEKSSIAISAQKFFMNHPESSFHGTKLPLSNSIIQDSTSEICTYSNYKSSDQLFPSLSTKVTKPCLPTGVDQFQVFERPPLPMDLLATGDSTLLHDKLLTREMQCTVVDSVMIDGCSKSTFGVLVRSDDDALGEHDIGVCVSSVLDRENTSRYSCSHFCVGAGFDKAELLRHVPHIDDCIHASDDEDKDSCGQLSQLTLDPCKISNGMLNDEDHPDDGASMIQSNIVHCCHDDKGHADGDYDVIDHNHVTLSFHDHSESNSKCGKDVHDEDVNNKGITQSTKLPFVGITKISDVKAYNQMSNTISDVCEQNVRNRDDDIQDYMKVNEFSSRSILHNSKMCYGRCGEDCFGGGGGDDDESEMSLSILTTHRLPIGVEPDHCMLKGPTRLNDSENEGCLRSDTAPQINSFCCRPIVCTVPAFTPANAVNSESNMHSDRAHISGDAHCAPGRPFSLFSEVMGQAQTFVSSVTSGLIGSDGADVISISKVTGKCVDVFSCAVVGNMPMLSTPSVHDYLASNSNMATASLSHRPHFSLPHSGSMGGLVDMQTSSDSMSVTSIEVQANSPLLSAKPAGESIVPADRNVVLSDNVTFSRTASTVCTGPATDIIDIAESQLRSIPLSTFDSTCVVFSSKKMAQSFPTVIQKTQNHVKDQHIQDIKSANTVMSSVPSKPLSVNLFPKYLDVLRAGVLQPGTLNLLINWQGWRKQGSILRKGRIADLSGLTFTTPLNWFRSVTAVTNTTRAIAYRKIFYNHRPLSSIFEEFQHSKHDKCLAASRKRKISHANRIGNCPTEHVKVACCSDVRRTPTIQTVLKPVISLTYSSSDQRYNTSVESNVSFSVSPARHSRQGNLVLEKTQPAKATITDCRTASVDGFSVKSLSRLKLVEDAEIEKHVSGCLLEEFWNSEFCVMDVAPWVWATVDVWES